MPTENLVLEVEIFSENLKFFQFQKVKISGFCHTNKHKG